MEKRTKNAIKNRMQEIGEQLTSSTMPINGSAERMAKLKEAAKPLLKLLSEEYHPHHTAIVTGISIELLEGVCSIPKIYDYVVD